MAVNTVGDITSITFFGTVFEQRVLNTLHYRTVAAWDQDSIWTYYNAFHNQFKATGTFDIVTPFLNCLSGDYHLDQIRVQVVAPTRYRARFFDTGGFGTRSGACKTANMAATITKQTEKAGRSQVGSLHLGGISGTDVADGLASTTLVSGMNQLCITMLNHIYEDFGPGHNVPVLYHPKQMANAGYDYLASCYSHPEIRTQRTRTIGKGE